MRLRAIRSEWLPQFDATAYAQYQSEVVTIPFDLPGGVEPFTPHKDTYDAHLGVRQPLYDPFLGARRSVESAQLAESQARVRTTLFTLRQSVAESYFTALLLQAQARRVGGGAHRSGGAASGGPGPGGGRGRAPERGRHAWRPSC